MSIQTLCCAALVLLLTACGGAASDPAPAAAPTAATSAQPASPAPTERPRRERVDCAVHYATARDAVLGTLRGTEHLPLIAPVTALSEGVLSPLPDGASPQSADCSFAQRQLLAKRQPDATPPRTLAPTCAALVESIDRACLQPLAQRGVPFTSACNTLLVGIADGREELDRKLGNDGYCASMASTL